MDRPFVGVACIIVRDKRVLLGKRKGAVGEGTWQFPGGHLEFNEEPEETVKREVLEEVGLKVEDPKFVAMTNDIFRKENKHYITLFFMAKSSEGEPKVMEPEKCEKWEWFEWDKKPTPLFPPILNLLKQKFNLMEHIK